MSVMAITSSECPIYLQHSRSSSPGSTQYPLNRFHQHERQQTREATDARGKRTDESNGGNESRETVAQLQELRDKMTRINSIMQEIGWRWNAILAEASRRGRLNVAGTEPELGSASKPLTARGLGGTKTPAPEGQLCDFPVQTDVQILLQYSLWVVTSCRRRFFLLFVLFYYWIPSLFTSLFPLFYLVNSPSPCPTPSRRSPIFPRTSSATVRCSSRDAPSVR